MSKNTQPESKATESEAVSEEVPAASVETYDPEEKLDRNEATKYLGLENPNTLSNWAAKGYGPARIKYGSGRTARVVYRRADLDAFIRRCTIATNQAGR